MAVVRRLLFLLVWSLLPIAGHAGCKITSNEPALSDPSFATPAAAHAHVVDYMLAAYADTAYVYASDAILQGASWEPGTLVSWICFKRREEGRPFDARACQYVNPTQLGAEFGHTLHFVAPESSPSLERDTVRPVAGKCSVHPIHLATGNKYQVAVDYRSAPPDPLTFARFYNSRLAAGNTTRMGAWRHTYMRSVDLDLVDPGPYMVALERPNGQRLMFYRYGDGWKAAWPTSAQLVAINEVF